MLTATMNSINTSRSLINFPCHEYETKIDIVVDTHSKDILLLLSKLLIGSTKSMPAMATNKISKITANKDTPKPKIQPSLPKRVTFSLNFVIL